MFEEHESIYETNLVYKLVLKSSFKQIPKTEKKAYFGKAGTIAKK